MSSRCPRRKPFDEYAEAKELGIDTVPVLSARSRSCCWASPPTASPRSSTASTCSRRCSRSTRRCSSTSAGWAPTWVQLDEPCLSRTAPAELDALALAYEELGEGPRRARICVNTYFDHVGEAYGVLPRLPVAGIGARLRARRAGPRPAMDRRAPRTSSSSPTTAASRTRRCSPASSPAATSGSTTSSAASTCSATSATAASELVGLDLLLAPALARDRRQAQRAALDDELRSWMAFAVQKLDEVATLARA